MPRFKPYNDDQDTMVVINYQDQLQPGTVPKWAKDGHPRCF